MKVLFISWDGLTDALGQSQIIPYMGGLAKEGHEITILSCDKPDKLLSKKKKIESIIKNAGLNWKHVEHHAGIPVLSQLLNYTRLKKAAMKLHRENHFDAFHCRSYVPALIGLKAKKEQNVKFIFDMRGFWADERVDGGLWRKSNGIQKYIYNWFKKKEKELIGHSDHVVSLTERAIPELLKIVPGLPESAYSVIPCCCDETVFNAAAVTVQKKEELRKSLGAGTEDFVLCYHGSIGTWYMIEEMLQFYKRLKARHPRAKFLILSHAKKEKVTACLNAIGLDERDIIFRSAERNEIPLYLGISDLCIFFIRASYSKLASSPTKLAEISMMGKYYVTNAGVGDVDNITAEGRCGFVVASQTIEEYDRVIAQVENIDHVFSADVADFAHKRFSLARGIKKYSDIYKTIYTK